MKYLAWYLLVSFGSMYALWVFYLAVMNLKRARDAGYLVGFVYYLAQPVVLVGILTDIFVNLFVCSLIFLERPRESLVTSRLKRHINSEGWRSSVAAWICVNLLNKFDPSGNHCKD